VSGWKVPRVVVVTRATDYQALLARHGTRDQARFFLETRGESIDDAEERHHRFEAAYQQVSQAVPVAWRRAQVVRSDLASFVFEASDIVVALGQDGLVANVAKYLSGQPVLGVNPDPDRYDGVLVQHHPEDVRLLLRAVSSGRYLAESRTMVEASLDDGQRLLALNEVFLGHITHQSARYWVHWNGCRERQSSSGLIVATGTGATGWARSIHRQRSTGLVLPRPSDPTLAFLVREPFPSVATGTSVEGGVLPPGQCLEATSEMHDGGTLFGDGIEEDRLAFPWGMRAIVRAAAERLQLVTG
jgi:NAD kinase